MKVRNEKTILATEDEADWRMQQVEEAKKVIADLTARLGTFEQHIAELVHQSDWWKVVWPGHAVGPLVAEALAKVTKDRDAIVVALAKEAAARDLHQQIADDMYDRARQDRIDSEMPPREPPAGNGGQARTRPDSGGQVGRLVATVGTVDQPTQANPLPNGVARLEMSLACTSGQHDRCQDPDGSHPSDRCQCPECCGLAVATIPAEREDTEAGQ